MIKYLLLIMALLSVWVNSNAQQDIAIKKAGILSYTILEANQSKKKPLLNEYLEVDYRMSVGSNDSLLNETFTSGEKIFLPVNHPSFKDVFLQLREGDRVQIMISTDSFYKYTTRRPIPEFVKSGDSISFYIKVYTILNDEGLMKKQMEKDAEYSEADSASFHSYLRGFSNVQSTERGLYYMVTRKSEGSLPKSGDSVTVKYRGYFLDGRVFDKDENGYTFLLGLGQVIAGWDEGVALMREGEKFKLFIPYYLAYGTEGSKLIPPYSSLIFDVELIKIKRNY